MAYDHDARQAVTDLLAAAQFTAWAGTPRRRRDPAASDGFIALSMSNGGVYVVWKPWKGGNHKNPAEVIKSREMAEAYAGAARAAGWTAEIDGVIWYGAHLTRPEAQP